VIENAPLGVRSGKAAGLTVYAVNTGILSREDLLLAGADKVFDSMSDLLKEISQ
jgi:beta-phosphoglucomutase-like phosphatase (HAD superfamily)